MGNRQHPALAFRREGAIVASFEPVIFATSFSACRATLRRLALVITVLVACAGPAAGQQAHQDDAFALGALRPLVLGPGLRPCHRVSPPHAVPRVPRFQNLLQRMNLEP